MRYTESVGNGLTGTVDGHNRDFYTRAPMNLDDVGVYINGRLKVAALDDGYEVPNPRQVRLREAPRLGDTVQVDYAPATSVLTLGGSSGPAPPRPRVKGGLYPSRPVVLATRPSRPDVKNKPPTPA